MRHVYLDHSATTPVDARVVEAMLPYLRGKFGNASSIHQFGQEARAAVDKARRSIASLINARPNEIVFTSGGTEANNLAIRGVCEAAQMPGRHLITSAIEHPSVRGVFDYFEKQGWSITRLPVYDNGIVRVEDVRAAMRDETMLVSVMTANNEIGTIQPVHEIGALIRAEREQGRRQLRFHTDAVQAGGRLAIDVESIGCDLLSLSAHKMYAPKGTGALFVRRGVRLFPQQIGGRELSPSPTWWLSARRQNSRARKWMSEMNIRAGCATNLKTKCRQRLKQSFSMATAIDACHTSRTFLSVMSKARAC